MKIQIVLAFLMSSIISAQQKERIEDYQGIWIAKPYYESFEKTKNALASKKAFAPTGPVGLRINMSEVTNGKLSVGLAMLHDHLLRAEVSQYVVQGKDTLYEQGFFSIQLKEQDKNNAFNVYQGPYFGRWSPTKLILKENAVVLQRGGNSDVAVERISYVRIAEKFEKEYQFPNPLYYYMRKSLLTGDFTLKDSTDTTICPKFTIHPDGRMEGYSKLKNKSIYYSTDIYCGPEIIDEVVLIAEEFKDDNPHCAVFVFKKIDEKTIYLYKTYPRTNSSNGDVRAAEQKAPLGKVFYKLLRH